jgi:DNA-binding XRE family transcriptional regulator
LERFLTKLLTGQLLEITQRTVVAVFDCPSQRFSPRKLIPFNVTPLVTSFHLARIKANLSQPEMAQKLGVSIRTVRKWEHGHACPDQDHWQVLAHHFGLDCQLLKTRIQRQSRMSGFRQI